ncbi:hypothetical protein ACWEQ1_12480 [Streptomyces nodosus]
MVTVSHTMVVAAVPRAWFMGIAARLVGLAEESRAEGERILLPDGRVVPDIRLVTGRHLRPGAVYDASTADDKVRVTLREWDGRRGARLEQSITAVDTHLALDIAWQSLERPQLVEVSGETRQEGGPTLSGATGRARLRLDDWWTAAETGKAPGSTPVRARVDHAWARAEFGAAPRPHDAAGRWEMHVTVTVRGRRLLRPIGALVLPLARRPIRRALVRALDDLAEQWNEQLPRHTGRDPEQVVTALLAGP